MKCQDCIDSDRRLFNTRKGICECRRACRRAAITNTAAFATIDAHFEGWARTTTYQTAAQGFVSWAWDTREEMIADLKSGDLTQTCEDVVYSIGQEAALDGEIEVPSDLKAAAWLAYHRDDLINELTESLDD